MFGSKKITTIVATALVIGMGFSAVGFAGEGKGSDVELAINPATTVIFGKSDITEGHMDMRFDENGLNPKGPFDCGTVDNGVVTVKDCDYVPESPFPTNALTIHWSYTGDVYAIEVDDDSGEMKRLGKKIGTVNGTPSFPAQFGAFLYVDELSDPAIQVVNMMKTETLPWTCSGCDLKINGSTFRKIDSMPLTGRSFIGLGAVDNPEGKLGLRMAGCAGIQEVSGEGDYADMHGTICLNGTIGFNKDFTGVGTSNCVMVLQDGPYVPTL